MAPRVIALYSSAPQMGKTKIAQYLDSEWGYTRLRFAGPIKLMVESLFGSLDIHPDRTWDYLYGGAKEEVVPEIGVTARYLMQTLGCEWGRNTINVNLWASIVVRGINQEPTKKFVIDDLRFPNEAAAIRKIDGAQIWRVERNGVNLNHEHPSDGFLDAIRFDHTISNNGSFQEMWNQIDKALEE